MLLLLAGTGAAPAPSSRAEQRAELEPAAPAGDGVYERRRGRTAYAHAVSRGLRDDDEVARLKKRVLHEVHELAQDVERSVARKRLRLDAGARLLERAPPAGTVPFPMVGIEHEFDKFRVVMVVNRAWVAATLDSKKMLQYSGQASRTLGPYGDLNRFLVTVDMCQMTPNTPDFNVRRIRPPPSITFIT